MAPVPNSVADDVIRLDLDSEASPTRSGKRARAIDVDHNGFVGRRLLGLRATIVAADVLVMAVTMVMAAVLRWGPAWPQRLAQEVPAWPGVMGLYVVGTMVVLRLAGLHRMTARLSIGRELGWVLRGVGVVAALTFALLFLTDTDELSRIVVGSFLLLLTAGLTGNRLALREVFRRRRQRGLGVANALMVGSGPLARKMVDDIRSRPEAGLHVVGYLGEPGSTLPGCDRLGDVEDLPTLLLSSVIDEVVVCLPLTDIGRITRCARIATEQGKPLRLPLLLIDDSVARAKVEHVCGTPVLSLVGTPDNPITVASKRTIDVVGASLALVAAAPLLLLAAVLIRQHDRGPVLFRQTRVGLHGRPFTMVKLRTMVTDAEDRRDEVAHLNERAGPVFKAAADPRVTPIGSLLRRTSIDELPQLLNVVRGDMSLVGPRPPLPDEVAAYDPWHRRRLSMRPGITGLWQVSLRNDADFDSWVSEDLRYIDSWSLGTDVRIMLRTVGAVVRMTGA